MGLVIIEFSEDKFLIKGIGDERVGAERQKL